MDNTSNTPSHPHQSASVNSPENLTTTVPYVPLYSIPHQAPPFLYNFDHHLSAIHQAISSLSNQLESIRQVQSELVNRIERIEEQSRIHLDHTPVQAPPSLVKPRPLMGIAVPPPNRVTRSPKKKQVQQQTTNRHPPQ
jgi:hypothetical protein